MSLFVDIFSLDSLSLNLSLFIATFRLWQDFVHVVFLSFERYENKDLTFLPIVSHEKVDLLRNQFTSQSIYKLLCVTWQQKQTNGAYFCQFNDSDIIFTLCSGSQV